MSAQRSRSKGATWDRATTEASLETAALKLLNQKGILAGLNLREVADEAGVNRGLVYHYFGGGRDLLRSALRKDARQRLKLMGRGSSSFGRRAQAFVRTMVEQAEWVRVVIILMLDNDERIRILPLKDQVLPDLRDRQRRGELTSEIDIEAFHVLQTTFGYGYALTRTNIALELGVDLEELDERVTAVAGWLAHKLETDPAPED